MRLVRFVVKNKISNNITVDSKKICYSTINEYNIKIFMTDFIKINDYNKMIIRKSNNGYVKQSMPYLVLLVVIVLVLSLLLP